MNSQNIIFNNYSRKDDASINPFDGFNIKYFINRSNNNNNNACAICLNICTIPCYTNSYVHIFCYNCLKIWSKTKKIYPLCRKYFSKIIRC